MHHMRKFSVNSDFIGSFLVVKRFFVRIRKNSSYEAIRTKLLKNPSGNYGPIFDVVTTKQHGDWYIMVGISKIEINNSKVRNFVMKVNHTL